MATQHRPFRVARGILIPNPNTTSLEVIRLALVTVQITTTTERQTFSAPDVCDTLGLPRIVSANYSNLDTIVTFTSAHINFYDYFAKFKFGSVAQTSTEYVPVCATPTANVITDANLNGLTLAQVSVTQLGYLTDTDERASEFEVIASPAVPAGQQVAFDAVANTLTFAAAYGADEVAYAYETTGPSRETYGGNGATRLTTAYFLGEIVNDQGPGNDLLHIPSIIIDPAADNTFGTGQDGTYTLVGTVSPTTDFPVSGYGVSDGTK